MEGADKSFDQARHQIGHVAELRGIGWGTLALGFYEPAEQWLAGLLAGDVAADLKRATGWLDSDHERFAPHLAALARFCQEHASTPFEPLFHELRAEYARLFIGSGGPPVAAPYESVHLDGAEGEPGLVLGPSATAVADAYRRAGLHPSGEGDLPDHVAMECEFLHALANREQEAWQRGDAEQAGWFRREQQVFLRDHAARWLPAFSRTLEEQAAEPYRALGGFLGAFVAVESGTDYANTVLRGIFEPGVNTLGRGSSLP